MEDNNDVKETTLEESGDNSLVETNSENEIVKIEVPKNEKKKAPKRKLLLIVLATLFIILLVLGIWLLFFNKKKESKEELDKNFTITSVEAKTKGNYVSNNETFIVKTSSANEEIVKTHLYVEPAVNYEIKKINSKEYEVSLSDVPSDTIVNLSLVKDEVKSYSWAFQTTKDLKVVSVYPTSGASSVSTDTGIYVSLSYPNVENFEEHFNISPKVEGTFTHNGRTWKFVPKTSLKDKTTYTITISSGLSAGENILNESYVTSFSTYNRPANNSTLEDIEGKMWHHSSITIDKINTFTPSEKVTFKMYYLPSEISKIKMYKFNSYNDFMKFINNEKDYKTTDLGEQSYTKNKDTFTYILDKSFQEGYYVEEIYLDSGELYSTIPVQINSLSAFLIASNSDILTWVGSGNKLLKDINVSFDGKNNKTNENGLAIVKNYDNYNNDEIKYVTVGDSKNPLVIGVRTYDYVDYPSGYLYTDRPLYKNTDVINIWGYIPLKFFKEINKDLKNEDFVLTINEEKVPIDVSEDGTFIAKYNLDNYVDSSVNISISYKNMVIASRYVEVKNYTKQNYEYSVIYDKNYIKNGDNFNFTIHVKHVTGIDVQNKKIVVQYNDKTYTKVTDADGNAKFTLPTEKHNYNNGEPSSFEWSHTYDYEYISVNTGDSDFSENDFSFGFYKINYLIDVVDYDYNSKTSTISMSVNTLTLNGNKNVDWDNFSEILKDGVYSGNVDVYLFERLSKRVYSGDYYNEYTQETEKLYNYVVEYDKVVNKDTLNIKNGKIDYKINYEFKKDTEDDSYSYSIVFVFKDKNGNKYFYNGYVYRYSSYDDYEKYGYHSEYNGYYGEDYEYYRYYFTKEQKNKYSVNDQINLLLKSYNNQEIKKGKILRVSLKDSIVDNKIFDVNDNLNAVFNKSDIPGITYAGALFTGGKFYRIPATYYDYNEEDSKLNIELKLDKEKYKPGDEVVVKITTKDKDNKPVKAKVNLSVVDKAVFNVANDYTNILETVYSNRYLRAYLYSSYRDYALGQAGGGRGDTGDNLRSNFGDTVYFNEIETNSKGEAEIKFKLNDSVTTFVLTTHASNADVQLGNNKKEIVSTLPLAISVIEPKGLKTSDDVVISANSVGSVKTDVKYTFTLKELNKKQEKTGKIGATVYANFGKLPEGTYTIVINAVSGNEKDAIEFPFVVKASQQEIAVKTTSTIGELQTIKPLKNPIVLEFYKDGFEKYMKYLDIMLETNQDRLDTRVAYYKALELENKYYGYEYPIHINDMAKFNHSGILRYLENDSDSPVVTALVNYYYPNIYDLKAIDYYSKFDNTDYYYEAIDYLLVLSSMREPVLDELNYMKKNVEKTDSESLAKLALSYAFIGDYNSAKELYKQLSNSSDIDGYLTILATFIDKNNASKMIDELYTKENANRYVFFAMMSYFNNNEVDLSKESTIKVTYGDKEEIIKIKGLKMEKLIISNKDLETLNFSSNDKKDRVNYYYEGGISEVPKENVISNIKLSVDSKNLSVGQTLNIKLDVSKINEAGSIKVYLPNSMRFSGSIDGTGAYLSANKGEYIVIYLSEKHASTITIPVYITYPGSYKIEEAILKVKDKYYISNSLDVNIK